MPIEPTTAGMIASAGISAGASLLGANKSAKAARELTERQIAWERERAVNAHQWEMQDLKAAGLNPALTASGTGAETSGITGAMPDYSGIAEGGKNVANSIEFAIDQSRKNKLTNSETSLNNANTLKTIEQTKTEKLEQELKVAEKEATWAKAFYTWAMEDKTRQETFGVQAETALKKALKIKEEKQTQLIESQTKTEGVKRGKMTEETNLLKTENEIKKVKEQIIKKYGMKDAQIDLINKWATLVKTGVSTVTDLMGSIMEIFTGGAAKAVVNFLKQIKVDKARGDIEIIR